MPFVAIAVATFSNNWSLYTFLSYLPKYVNAPITEGGMGIDLESNIFVFAILIPCVVAILSLVIGGYLADGLIKRGYAVIKSKKSCKFNWFLWFRIIFNFNSSEDSLFNVVLLLSMINVCSGICAGGFGVNHADLGPKYTGSLVGISGSIGMIATILSPIVAGTVLQITNSWSMIFYICAGMLIFGGMFYLIFASANKQFD